MLFSRKKFLSRKYKAAFFFSVLAGAAVFLVPELAQAASVNLGMGYGNATGLPGTDPRLVVARLIQVVLGFLGIIALSLVIYGGFLWMTSGGNPEKVDKAKKVLANAVIGLIIILSAFGIATFILNKIQEAVGQGTPVAGGPSEPSSSLGVIGSCIVERVYPEPGQEEVPRNTSIIVSFKEAIDSTTVCSNPSNDTDGDGNLDCDGEMATTSNVKIYKRDQGPGNAIQNVRVTQTDDDKTFVFTPEDYLGSASEYIWYGVTLTKGIKKQSNGKSAFSTCQQNFLQWYFEVSNELDLTPPQVKNIFPPPDDQQDQVTQVSSLAFATGDITVQNNPEIYKPATTTSVTPNGAGVTPNVTATADNNCEQNGQLRLAVQSDGETAVLENVSSSTNLGTALFDDDTDTVSFGGILEFTVNDGYGAGDSWDIYMDSVQYPDTITVGSETYIFSDNSNNNKIQVDPNNNITADYIATKLDSRDDLIATSASGGDTVNLKAAEGGSEGNSITVDATEHGDDDFDITPMSGGQDEQENVNIQDKEDQPKNAIIQINFNEAMNPITLSGAASNLNNYIRIVNASTTASTAGSSCNKDSDCQSLNCNTSGSCVGSYLPGKFLVANNYQTVEFQSDNQCGTNACGEDIYCLPENVNIKVEMEAAELEGCGAGGNCSTRPGYNTCTTSPGSFTTDTCANSDGEYYPLSHLPLNGVADAAMNSLDGNKDGEAVGPVSYYNVNVGNNSDGDSYTWSFWTNDELEISPPVINSITPQLNGTTSDLAAPVEAHFDELMKVKSLTTGATRIDTGDEIVEHKLINLWNFSGGALGYWITAEGVDESPQDGYPDRTNAIIGHSMFGDSMDYRAQIGSGVKDIYQNCYKPSDGPGCSPNSTNPSCCNGTAVSGDSCP